MKDHDYPLGKIYDASKFAYSKWHIESSYFVAAALLRWSLLPSYPETID
jgi:hypothetical protein